MAKQTVKISLEFEYNPDEHNGMPLRNFLYHYLNRLNNELPITEIQYKGQIRKFAAEEPLTDLPLKEVDSINEKDRPKKPDMSNVTKLPEFKK